MVARIFEGYLSKIALTRHETDTDVEFLHLIKALNLSISYLDHFNLQILTVVTLEHAMNNASLFATVKAHIFANSFFFFSR